MIAMRFVWELHTDDPISPDDLFMQGNELMEALLKHEGCNAGNLTDSTVGVDAGKRVVTAEFVIKAADLDEGMTLNMAVMRSALHAIGGYTPGWPSPHEVVARYGSPEFRLLTTG